MSEHKIPEGEEPRWLDKKQNVDRIWHVLVVICAGLFLADFAYHKHTHFDVEQLTGFHALFGFCAYVGLVTAAKGLRRLIRREEDYYD